MTITNTHRMEALISGIKGVLAIFCGLCATYIPINMLAAASIEGSTLELKTVASISVFGGAIIWWLAKKFQKIDDRLDSLESKKQRKLLKDHEE